MATAPQVTKKLGLDSDGSYILPSDHRLPGWTIEALLAEGKVEEARAELERLILEGIDSEPKIEVTPQFWADLRAEARENVVRKR